MSVERPVHPRRIGLPLKRKPARNKSVHERLDCIVRKETAVRRPSESIHGVRPDEVGGVLPLADVAAVQGKATAFRPTASHDLKPELADERGYELHVVRRLSGRSVNSGVGDV